MEIYERLLSLQSENKRIQVGQVGCGQMGSGLVHVTNQMPGMDSTAIADIDINRPIKVLKEMGLYDDTLIIFTADHGDSAGIHGGIFDKGAMAYEEIYHTPLIVKMPPILGRSFPALRWVSHAWIDEHRTRCAIH